MSLVRRTLVLGVFLALTPLVGCDGPGAPAPLATLYGLASLTEPVSGARVTVYDSSLRPITTAEQPTNENGSFAVAVPAALLMDVEARGDFVVVEVTGGTMPSSGSPATARLLYLVDRFDPQSHSFFHVGPLSTVLAHAVLDFPGASLPDRAAAARALFQIPAALDLENDLYFYDRLFDPLVIAARAAEAGGLDAFFAELAGYLDAPAGFDPCLVRDCVAAPETLRQAEEEEAFVGKALAEGVASQVGSQFAGYVFAGLNDNSAKQLASIGAALAQVRAAECQILAQLDELHFDQRVSSLSDSLSYLDTWIEKATFATTLSGSDYLTYAANRRAELNALPLAQFDGTDLIRIHESLMGAGSDDPLLDLAAAHFGNTPGFGSQYYAQLGAFMAYWIHKQHASLYLSCEHTHAQASPDTQDLKRILTNAETRFEAQADKFLALAERNLAIDLRTVNSVDKIYEWSSESPSVAYEGLRDFSRDWHTANWSFYPDSSHTDRREAESRCDPTRDCYTVYHFTRDPDPCWNTSLAPTPTRYAGPSKELQQADELMFQLSLYRVRRPLSIRAWVTPITASIFPSFPMSSAAIHLVDGAGTIITSALPVIQASVEVPASYYDQTPYWGTHGVMARFTFDDPPDGDYTLDFAALNVELSLKEAVFTIPFVDGFYRDYTIPHRGGSASTNMLINAYTAIPFEPR